MIEMLPPATPAATLIVLRDAAAGPPDILMVERARSMAFAAGALVFPGGRVDARDHALADDEEGAARVAAIRETIEEVGLAIGLVPPPGAIAIARLRAALHGGTGFAGALAEQSLALDLSALTPFARWRPAHRTSRIFDTRFYLARLPADAPPPIADQTEVVRAFWSSADATLAMIDAGVATAIFPTRRNLERLARFATVDAAFADAAARPAETITPWTETRDGVEHLCIPEGLGYPITSEPLADAVRG